MGLKHYNILSIGYTGEHIITVPKNAKLLSLAISSCSPSSSDFGFDIHKEDSKTIKIVKTYSAKPPMDIAVVFSFDNDESGHHLRNILVENESFSINTRVDSEEWVYINSVGYDGITYSLFEKLTDESVGI